MSPATDCVSGKSPRFRQNIPGLFTYVSGFGIRVPGFPGKSPRLFCKSSGFSKIGSEHFAESVGLFE
jgi:hypothetical protein